MSLDDLLSQDEIDALLHGVDEGEVKTEDEEGNFSPEGVRSYDFTSQDRIVRGRMPTLEMVSERFARYFRISLFNLLRRTAEVTFTGIQVSKFSEFINSLFVPTNLNLIRLKPLRGRALIVMEPTLVFTAVDNYFGGTGQFYNKIEGREFTPTEMRIIQILLEMAFKDLKEAWRPVMDVQFEYLNSEVNPQFANIVSPPEIVVTSTIHIELEGGGGDFHICLPYSMIEPIRELLDSIQSERGDIDDRWQRAMRYEVMETQVEVYGILLEKQLTLEDVLNFEPGDVIPVEIPEQVTLFSEDVPLFHGRVGVSNGNYAVKIQEKVERGPDVTPVTQIIDQIEAEEDADE
ncbi:flagellar motor switch protein FliM [Methylomarinovum caldicuralii]|uniref:Flagellar motor switch protein FliM n=1 Tax=Methylomarinovum caldicuralii TaxID=438856 RepID=A0AAU9CQ03_9GAMM|nr:flagellar motor switch protein FliM [Methylomarinovum caldicuralii]BCX81582.1 flagellar motor switch protein FliM [Methylomarinovum caldicuralii]